ncbi:MAG: hypothetical protein M1305_06935 [Candidatus Marsarchaeota archaeon]|nr:hypothetical protein [Candidatus Marsarchaeota archaeon]
MSMLDMMLETVQVTDMGETIKVADQDELEESGVITNHPSQPSLYVATNLDSWETDACLLDDEIIDGINYRRLDAPYYAWLRNKMVGIRKAKEAGKFSAKLYEELRERFNIVHAWALTNIGEDILLDTVRTFDLTQYMPPASGTHQTAVTVPQLSPEAQKLGGLLASQGYAILQTSIWDEPIVIAKDETISLPAKHQRKVTFTLSEIKFMVRSTPDAVRQILEIKKIMGGRVVGLSDDKEPISEPVPDTQGSLFGRSTGNPHAVSPSPESFARIDAIKEHALSLGWTESQLYQTESKFPFPYGDEYGLVCFLLGNRQTGEVTAQYIEILSPLGNRAATRFYNTNADQPWIEKAVQ